MAKMYSLKKILLPASDEVVPPKTVFDAAPTLAKQLMALKSARNATAAEVEAAELASKAGKGAVYTSVKEGDAKVIATEVVADTKPESGAKGDPQATPTGKSAS